MFPPKEKVQRSLPASFSKLRNIRVIIDCAEILCQSPSNFEHQGNLYSNYKAHTTFKVLLGKYQSKPTESKHTKWFCCNNNNR